LKAVLSRMQMAAGPMIGLVGLGGVGYVAKESVYNVEGGHKGILYSRISGIGEETYDEGFHLRFPGIHRPIIFNVRTRAHEYPNEKTGTKDLQMVTISVRVLLRPNTNQLPSIYRNWGPTEGDFNEQAFDKKILDSIMQESLKSNVARFNASQLITEREAVSRQIRQDLTNRAADFNLVIEDVSIVDLQFGRMYQAAVENKQVAQQMAQRAHIEVDRAEQEKNQKIVEAQGEQRSAELIGEAVKKSPAYLNLEKIKAARQIATTVAASQNRVYLSADSLLLDVNNTTIDSDSLSTSETKKSSGWL